MGPLGVVLLVAVILGIQALFWTGFLIWVRGRQRTLAAALRDEVLAAGETLKRGPESALYRGGTLRYSRVNGNGLIALTDRRLLFRKLIGGKIDVPLDRVMGVRADRWFLRSYRSGRLNLILQLEDGAEVGFIVADHPGWMAAVREAISA